MWTKLALRDSKPNQNSPVSNMTTDVADLAAFRTKLYLDVIMILISDCTIEVLPFNPIRLAMADVSCLSGVRQSMETLGQNIDKMIKLFAKRGPENSTTEEAYVLPREKRVRRV